jgi:hypothetical protein
MSKLSEKWQRGSFTIDHLTGPHSVEGLINGPFGIDKLWERKGDLGIPGRTWMLSHLKTGHLVAGFPTLKLAKLCAEKIAPRHTWERVEPKRPTRGKWAHTFAIICHAQVGEI